MSEWQDELSTEDLKTNPTLRNFETPEAAYQGLIDLKRREGGMIRLSSEDATDDDRAANRDKIMKAHPDLMLKPEWTDDDATKDYLVYQGVPTDAQGYELPDNTLPPEWIEELKTTALAEELTPRQMNKRVELMNKMYADQQESADAGLAEERQTLKNTWGAAHDDRMKQVEWVQKEFFSEFGELGAMNNIAIQGLYKLAQALQGHSQAHSQPNEPEAARTPEEARARVDELRNKIKENKDPSKKNDLIKQMVSEQKLTNPARYA